MVLDPEKFLERVAALPNALNMSMLGTDTDVELDHELRVSKEHFSKLKLEYLHLETKNAFLESLAATTRSEHDLHHVREEQMKELEDSVRLTKTQVQQAKRDLVRVKKEIRSAIHPLVENWEELAKRKDEVEAVYEREHFAAAQAFETRARELNQSSACFGRVDEEQIGMKTVGACESVLEAQRREIERLETELDASDRAVEEATAKRAKTTHAADTDKLERAMKQHQWYENVLKSLTLLTGINLKFSSDDNVLDVLVPSVAATEASPDVWKRPCYTLKVTFEGAPGSRILDAQVISPPSLPAVHVPGVARWARKLEDLNVLIREVVAKVTETY